MCWTIFSQNQGSGYIYNKEMDMINQIEPITVTINGIEIKPGDLTDLSGHFSGVIKFLGIKVDGRSSNEMVFELGKTSDLFETKHYYQSVFRISDNRIFEMYSHKAGRDFLFVDGHWK